MTSTEALRKAKRPTAREAQERQMAGALKVSLTRGIRGFKEQVSPEDLARALATGDYRKIMQTIPWDGLRTRVSGSFEKLTDAVQAGAQDHGIPALPRQAQPELRYDPSNPRIEAFVSRRAGEMVTTTQDGARQAAKDAVRRSNVEHVPLPTLAADIRGKIGLNEPQALALENYRSALTAADKSSAEVDRLVDAYRDRQLDYRADMIARTEVRRATNQGQLDVWQAATDDGLLPSGSEKVWVPDGKPCQDCSAMRDARAPLDGTWTFKVRNARGQVVDSFEVENPAESHPHCMCTMQLDVASAAQAEKRLRKAGEFNENDHPRDAEGQFVGGAGATHDLTTTGRTKSGKVVAHPLDEQYDHVRGGETAGARASAVRTSHPHFTAADHAQASALHAKAAKNAPEVIARAHQTVAAAHSDAAAGMKPAPTKAPAPKPAPSGAAQEHAASLGVTAHDKPQKLTAAEKSAAQDYQDYDQFSEKQGGLRRGDKPKDDPQVRALNQAIYKQPLQKDVTVYRGVQDNGRFGSLKPGSTLQDKGFTSFTTSPGIAGEFARSKSAPKKAVVFHLELKAGQHALSMNEHAPSKDYGHESELLLPTGAKYRIRSTHTEGGVRHVLLEPDVPRRKG